MGQITHTFEQGLEQDVSNSFFPNNKYYNLKNFRLTTDEGGSSLCLENEKGNRLDFSIPTTQQVYKVFVVDGATVTINGVEFIMDSTTTIDSLYNDMVNSLMIGSHLRVAAKSDHILVFGLDALIVASTDPTAIELVVTNITGTSIRIIHIDSFNDTIVLFTTGLGYSQIWMVDYNQQTGEPIGLTGNDLTPSVHLKYNGLLGFSPEFYIRKSIVRYENEKICRIYWTDNNNPVRSANLFDQFLFATDPSDLDFVSDVTFTKPVIFNIEDNGSIPFGSSVQFAYQLVNGDKETVVSPTSDLLCLYEENDKTAAWRDLNGSPQGSGASKSVTYNISNIDDNYDRIRHIAVLYEFNNLPVYKIFKEELIPSSRELNVTFTNDEEQIDLSEQEFNMLSAQFTHCKDFTQKDNRLIAVNTKSFNFEINDKDFDARAFRFKSDGTSIVKNKIGETTTIDTDFLLDYDHDAINPFNNKNDVDYDEYKYQSDGTTLGGEGLYVKYKFITKQIIIDNNYLSNFPDAPFADGPSRQTLLENFGNGINYNIEDQVPNYKSPYVNFLYQGYSRDEIYRFGIVFYNKKGQPSFTKWIGDIKFPSIDDINLTAFGGTTLYGNQIGIEFDITIPDDVKELISGYEIVRVERDVNNRTNLGGGIVSTIVTDGGTDLYDGSHILNAATYTSTGAPWRFVKMHSPNFLFQDVTKHRFKEGDYLEFNKHFNLDTSAFNSGNNPAADLSYYRAYELDNNDVLINLELNELIKVNYNGSFNLADFTTDTGGYTIYFNKGTTDRKCGLSFIGGLDLAAASYTTFGDVLADMNTTDDIIPYFTYKRNLANQYGGNTYEARSNNRYITTGCFIASNSSSVLKVYGGDTYVLNFGFEKIQNMDSASDSYSFGIFFPVECAANFDLRHGSFFNRNRGTSTANNLQYAQENYFLNEVYTQVNNSKQVFVAKPFIVNFDDQQPYAIHVSELKRNGELIDSWTKFKINNQIEVDGIYGEINAVANHQGRVYFFQDKAVGIVPINERVVTQNQDGIELQLGTGDVISVYGYISNQNGTKHTSSVIQSEDYLYFFDVRNRKLFRISSNTKQPLSDLKGLNSYFRYDPFVSETDAKTSLIPIGIHGTYDNRHNRVLFSFNNGAGKIISYSEILNCFEGEFDINSSVLHSTGRQIFSVAGLPSLSPRCNFYQHNVGNYCEFYGTVYDSSITLLSNAKNPSTKEWNNIQWYSECYDSLNNNIFDETYEEVKIHNDYQDTGSISLSGDNIKRRFRQWTHSIKRDSLSQDKLARIRNPWIYVKLTKKNDNNHRFIGHPITLYYLL
jgi:hypothetical protein